MSKKETHQRTDIFTGKEGTLVVSVQIGWQTTPEIFAAGDSRLGKGVLGAIPLHLIFESENLRLQKKQKLSWEINLELLK